MSLTSLFTNVATADNADVAASNNDAALRMTAVQFRYSSFWRTPAWVRACVCVCVCVCV